MKDLTIYGNDELSMVVFNDEYFYIERENIDYLIALINEEFLYTDAQLETLHIDLEDDRSSNL